MLKDAAAIAVLKPAPHVLVLAEAAPSAFFARCTCSSPSGARRCRCHRSLCISSSISGARRGRCHRSLCSCSSAFSAAQGSRAWALRGFLAAEAWVLELWPGLMHWLGLHHAPHACGAFLVAPRVACPSKKKSLPAVAASGSSVRSNILLCGVFSMRLFKVWCFHSRCLYVLFRST